MLREPLARICSARKKSLHRLDRVAAELNVFLVVFAIGLATLDLTFAVSERLIDRLPEATRVLAVNRPPELDPGR
jgi:hypothetical protein